MKSFKYVLTFMTGAVIGSAMSWWFLKDKYAAIAEEEIESVKTTYSQELEKIREHTKVEKTTAKPDLLACARILQEEGYTDYSRTSVPDKKSGRPDPEAPYIIRPEEFGEIEGYAQITLFYFSDGVLADENEEPVDDVSELVGDALEHFDEYEDDSVHIRNDAKRCDYEILKDQRSFSEVRKHRPPMDDEEED